MSKVLAGITVFLGSLILAYLSYPLIGLFVELIEDPLLKGVAYVGHFGLVILGVIVAPIGIITQKDEE